MRLISIIGLLFCHFVYSDADDYIFPLRGHSISNYGTVGLIQSPSARFLEEGTLAFAWTHNEPYLRGSIIATPFEWLEASYGYTDVNNALYSEVKEFSGSQSLKDKGFDTKIKLRNESHIFPQVAIGFRDFAGSGLFSGEYIVMNKAINNLDISFGLGWGNLNGNRLDNPLTQLSDRFYERGGQRSGTKGGEFSIDNYFAGDMGYFGGFEYFIPKLKGSRLKVEFDPTNYETEAKVPLRQDSKINISFIYPLSKNFYLYTSYVRGNTFSFGFSFQGNFSKRNAFVKKNDPQSRVKNAPIVRNVTSRDNDLLYKASLRYLRERGFYLQTADLNGDTLDISFSQSKYRDPAMAVGRATEILNDISPDYIKQFELTEVNAEMGMYKATIDRETYGRSKKYSDYSILLSSTKIESATFFRNDHEFKPLIKYPKIYYGYGPDLKSQIGGPDGFFFGDLRFALNSEAILAPGLSLLSSFSAGIVNNFDELKLPSDSILPHVRTDIVDYLKDGDSFSINRFQLNYFLNPIKDIYFKYSAGIFESMFMGAGFEFLYRPFEENYAIGLDMWRLNQRHTRQLFGRRNYSTSTGHLTLYYREPKTNVLVKFVGGRYLARDSGFTVDLSRRFPNGFNIGVFFSLTDISREEFGEGSFDKGFYWFIPIETFFSDYRKATTGWGLRPLTRDGAQRLIHAYELWGVTDNSSYYRFRDNLNEFFN